MREGVCSVIDYELMLNDEVKQLKPSGIRRFFDIANEMEHVISCRSVNRIFPHPGMCGRKESNPWKMGKHGILQTVVLSN